MDTFARNLKQRAAELGLSNAEVARRCGLSERRYAHYVVGDREPDLATLIRIATTLGTTPDVLLGVGVPSTLDARGQLLDRLIAAVSTLGEDELSLILIQVEAVAAARGMSG